MEKKEAPYWYKANWEPRKIAKRYSWDLRKAVKEWRPKWGKNKWSIVQMWKVNAVIKLMATWIWKVENERNKELWIKPWAPMTMSAACREVGISINSFIPHMKSDPDLSKMYQEYRENKQELLRFASEDNITKWILWELDLTDKEKVDTSLKVLQMTDSKYNQKIEVEQTTKNLNFNISLEDMENKFRELTSM